MRRLPLPASVLTKSLHPTTRPVTTKYAVPPQEPIYHLFCNGCCTTGLRPRCKTCWRRSIIILRVQGAAKAFYRARGGRRVWGFPYWWCVFFSSHALRILLLLYNVSPRLIYLDWPREETEVPGEGGNTHLWEESWDDDDTSEDFSKQLKWVCPGVFVHVQILCANCCRRQELEKVRGKKQ